MYTLDFDAGISGQRSGTPLQMQIQLVGGTTLLNQTITPPDAGTFDPAAVVFQHYHFTFTANSTTTTLRFTSLGTGNAYADQVVDTVASRWWPNRRLRPRPRRLPRPRTNPDADPYPHPDPDPDASANPDPDANSGAHPDSGANAGLDSDDSRLGFHQPGKQRRGSFFRVTASPVNSQPVTVFYTISGNAVYGTDYTLDGSPGQIVIPAGNSTASIPLHALGVPRSKAVEGQTQTEQWHWLQTAEKSR